MPQLVVRKVEETVVAKLRQQAARHGISMEEEHRRILRAALLQRGGGRGKTLKEYLQEFPDVGEDEAFERQPAAPRIVDL